MKVSVLGMGYVGCVTAACLCEFGHEVQVYDPSEAKRELLATGRIPIREPGVETRLADAMASGRLTLLKREEEAVTAALTMVCVGTATGPGSSPIDLSSVLRVTESLGRALKETSDFHVLVYRSTLLPGTTRQQIIPTLEQLSGKASGRGFEVLAHPEFTREGSAVRDFFDPPLIVAGASLKDSPGAARLCEFYEELGLAVTFVPLEVAELLKHACNAFHALKVAFANELGAIAEGLGIRGAEVMALFCRDRKLNLSSAYLEPGLPFGGSCLPKDLRALSHWAREQLRLRLPPLDHVQLSNVAHYQRIVERILASRPRRVGILGASFKPGIDDLRESPPVLIAQDLLDAGVEVWMHDPLVPAPKIHDVLSDVVVCPRIDLVIAESDLLVVSQFPTSDRRVRERLLAKPHLNFSGRPL